MKLLCIGDIHLGRQPSRLTPELLNRIGEVPGPAAAWWRAVEFALAATVDAVLLAGDVVEQEDDFYEAFGDLREGVRRLDEAGIRVIGVAGNHDVKVLPRLAEAVSGFKLLGRGGVWESVVLDDAAGRPSVRILGWSFPRPDVPESPLDCLPPIGDVPIPTLGLLHCDRDASGSRHAPTRGTALKEAKVDAWLLGHIHKPDALSGPRPMGYLGSLTGMDPGEAGPRGPWLLELKPGAAPEIVQIPLAPLRWEELTVSVEGLEEPADLHQRVAASLAELHRRIVDNTQHQPVAVGCRLRFIGRTGLRIALERLLASDDPRQNPDERQGIVYFVHDWDFDTAPLIDLDELAQGEDPVGLLARKILLLRDGTGREREEWIETARRALVPVSASSSRHYSSLGAVPPDLSETAALLEASARRALEGLLEQREVAS